MSVARINSDDLWLAAEWLDNNEGDDGEAETCRRVAAFLRNEAARREEAATVRALAKEKGVSPALIRKAIAKAQP